MNRHFENQMLEVAEDGDDVKGMFTSLRVSACPADVLNGEDAILSEMGLVVKSMTWEDVQLATKKDPTSLKLKQWINNGCNGPFEYLDEDLKPYWRIRSQLRTLEDVPMLNDRTIIPRNLRGDVLDTLHFICHKVAPSQAKLPQIEPVVPDYPFQHICMDYFQLNGKSYGIVVDRFSNWPMLYAGDTMDDVCNVLTLASRDYGIPDTISTDGAQCYVV